MKQLSVSEIQWLEVFAKNYEFFASFLLHYKLKQYLSNNQYYWLNIFIKNAIEVNIGEKLEIINIKHKII